MRSLEPVQCTTRDGFVPAYASPQRALHAAPLAQWLGMIVRDLSGDDFHKGYLDLLKQLTIVGDVTLEAYKGRFQEIDCNPDYIIKVIEDEVKGLIVATGTLFIERKFIRSCAKAGHVEDVVVSDVYRGQRLGQRVIEELFKAAEAAGCYKVILDCAEANVDFYAKCGLVRKEVQMVKYFQM